LIIGDVGRLGVGGGGVVGAHDGVLVELVAALLMIFVFFPFFFGRRWKERKKGSK